MVGMVGQTRASVPPIMNPSFVVSPSSSSGQACRSMNGPFDRLRANGERLFG